MLQRLGEGIFFNGMSRQEWRRFIFSFSKGINNWPKQIRPGTIVLKTFFKLLLRYFMNVKDLIIQPG